MIARTWRGATEADVAQNYVAYLKRTGFREYAGTHGNLGAIGLRRVRDGRAEFLILSLWESPDAVRRFAGPQPERAVFYPEDDRFLVDRDEHVDHFEVVWSHMPAPSIWRRVFRWWMSHWEDIARQVPTSGWRLAAFR